MKQMLCLLAAAAFIACSDEPFTPTTENVAGTYHALQLTTYSTITTDWVSQGATVTISLHTNGTTSGRLFIPGAGPAGGDFDEDMAGTWELNGKTITFNQTADTFVRDMEFTAERDRLVGDETFAATRIRVILLK